MLYFSSVKEKNISPRITHRRRIQQRQTMIFGTIAAVMSVLFILCGLIFAGILPSPINRAFSQRGAYTAGVAPCIKDGTPEVDLKNISVTIYNSTAQAGLARQVSNNLNQMGVNITNIANWGGDSIREAALIQTGIEGIPAAYTLAQYIPGSVIRLDKNTAGQNLSVVLGVDYTQLADPTEVAHANPEGKLHPIEGCEVVTTKQEQTKDNKGNPAQPQDDQNNEQNKGPVPSQDPKNPKD